MDNICSTQLTSDNFLNQTGAFGVWKMYLFMLKHVPLYLIDIIPLTGRAFIFLKSY